jgi:hypothetical protein
MRDTDSDGVLVGNPNPKRTLYDGDEELSVPE